MWITSLLKKGKVGYTKVVVVKSGELWGNFSVVNMFSIPPHVLKHKEGDS